MNNINKRIFLASLLICIFLVPIDNSALASDDIKIVSMNIHCLKDNWTFRTSKILDELIKISPEVINFQEVCRNLEENQIVFIKDYLLKNGYPLQSIHTQFTHKSWDIDSEYLATFSKLSSDEVQKGNLPYSPLQRAYLATKYRGIWIVNTHLEHRTDYAHYRKEQIQFLIEKFMNAPHLIIGDFNSSPKTPEQAPFHQSGYKSFFPGKTHLGDGSQTIYDIDGVWTSPAFQTEVKKSNAKIILNKPVDGIYLSDHFGILFNYDSNLYKDCSAEYTDVHQERCLPSDLRQI